MLRSLRIAVFLKWLIGVRGKSAELFNGLSISKKYMVLHVDHIELSLHLVQVQARIAKRPSLIQELDNKLKEIGREFGVQFGGEEFSYNFLSHSSDYFTKVSQDFPVLMI
jgi:hypothetical protein